MAEGAVELLTAEVKRLEPELRRFVGPRAEEDVCASCGNDPFEGGRIGDLVLQICVRPLPVPSEVHPGVARGFDAWFARACARDPQQRFQSASELADALRDACASTSSLRPRPCHTAPSSP